MHQENNRIISRHHLNQSQLPRAYQPNIILKALEYVHARVT